MAYINYIYFFILYSIITITANEQKNYNNTNTLRKKRYLLFPNPLDSETKLQVLFGLGLPMEEEISMTLGYVLKCNYNLPYNTTDFTQPYIRYQRDIKNNGMSRWELYRIFELALNSLGSGKACLLRAVCETAENSFDQRHGLFGELLHIFFNPSATKEQYKFYEDREYHAAELIGRLSIGECKSIFHECTQSPLDYFTIIR
ncbi:hypothetical protein PV325_000756 [Microctonus aethiopoides]|nr:hypothetical protein PV325_000756 [Microctonus aethiopoides]